MKRSYFTHCTHEMSSETSCITVVCMSKNGKQQQSLGSLEHMLVNYSIYSKKVDLGGIVSSNLIFPFITYFSFVSKNHWITRQGKSYKYFYKWKLTYLQIASDLCAKPHFVWNFNISKSIIWS